MTGTRREKLLNKENKSVKKKSLLLYHLEPKFTFDCAYLANVNEKVHIQLNTQILPGTIVRRQI